MKHILNFITKIPASANELLKLAIGRAAEACRENQARKPKDVSSFFVPGDELYEFVQDYAENDRWLHEDFPNLVQERTPMHMTKTELFRVVDWKFQRGVRRHQLVKKYQDLTEEEIQHHSTEAFAYLLSPSKTRIEDAMKAISRLNGVGPATASAILSPLCNELPYMTDEVLEALTGKRDYKLGQYKIIQKDLHKYVIMLNKIIKQISGQSKDVPNWNDKLLETAMWTFSILQDTDEPVSLQPSNKRGRTDGASEDTDDDGDNDAGGGDVPDEKAKKKKT